MSYKMTKIYKNKAFSMLEMSIVLFLIGLLLSSIIQAHLVIKQSRLSSAQTLTKSAPVSGINNLLFWYDATAVKAFDQDYDDEEGITIWYDQNPQSQEKNNATSNNTQPTLKVNGINGLPSISFTDDGTKTVATDQTYFTYNGNGLLASDYTIFIVEKRLKKDASAGLTCAMGGSGTAALSNLGICYSFSGSTYTLETSHYISSNALSATAIADTNDTVVNSFSFRNSAITYYRNGVSTGSATGAISPLTSYPGAMIGNYNPGSTTTNGFYGLIGEVIGYSQALSDSERKAVEVYLGKKWGVQIN